MNKAKTSLLVFTSVVALLILFGAVFKLSSAYLVSSSQPKGCRKDSVNHKAVVQNDKVTPEHISAQKCDTLTITNKDGEERLMAFGPHEEHVAYDGITERLLQKGQSFTIALNRTGNYRFHDHEHDEVQGTFMVSN